MLVPLQAAERARRLKEGQAAGKVQIGEKSQTMKKVQEMKKEPRFTKRDTLVVKGIAILLMLFYHLFESGELLDTLNVDHRPFSQDTFLMLSGFGNICVALFVFLSAYGITKGLSAEESGETYDLCAALRGAWKRGLKLIGSFVVMYISVNLLWFSYFDYGKLYGSGWQGGMFGLLDMLGLANIFDTPTLNMTWWYMETALVIIFLIPLVYPAVKKAGRYLILPALLLPSVVQMDGDMARYYLVMLLGAVAAREGWLEKLLTWKLKKCWKALLGLILLVLAVLVRQNFMVHSYFLWILDGPIALFLCWFAAEMLAGIPGLSQILAFLGRYSMNMFFVHTFFYMSLFREFIYSFRYAGLIFLVLTGVSLSYSIVLELIKSGGKLLFAHFYKKAHI